MVMLSNQGTYIAKIVRMLNSSENTVRQWIARFEAKRQMFSMMNLRILRIPSDSIPATISVLWFQSPTSLLDPSCRDIS
jgi:hypothetical protein